MRMVGPGKREGRLPGGRRPWESRRGRAWRIPRVGPWDPLQRLSVTAALWERFFIVAGMGGVGWGWWRFTPERGAGPPAAPPEGASLREGGASSCWQVRPGFVGCVRGLFVGPLRCWEGGLGFPSYRRPYGNHTGRTGSSRARCGMAVWWRFARPDLTPPARRDLASIADTTGSPNGGFRETAPCGEVPEGHAPGSRGPPKTGSRPRVARETGPTTAGPHVTPREPAAEKPTRSENLSA